MDRQKQLLQYLQSQGYYKDYDEAKFASKLSDPNWAGALYNGMRQNGLMSEKFDSFDSFANDLGIKKKIQPGAESGVGSQEVSLTPPQVEAPAPPSPQAPGPQAATTPQVGVPTQEQISREQLARQRQIAEQTPLVLSPERYKQAEQERAQPAELGQIEQDFPIKSPQSGVADLQRARSERMTGVQRPSPATPTVEMTGTAYKTKTEKRPIFGPSGDIIRFADVPVGPAVERERTLNSGLKLSEAYTLLKLRGEIPKETKIGEFVSQYAGNTNRLTELDTRISGIQQEKEQEKQAQTMRIQEEYDVAIKDIKQGVQSKTGKQYTDEQVKKMLEEQFGIYEPGKEPVQQAPEKPMTSSENYSRWGILRGVRQGLRGFAPGLELRIREGSKIRELGNDLIEGIAVDFDGEVSRLQSLVQKGLVDPKAPKELFDKRVEALKEKYPGGLIFPEIQQEYKTAKMIERELSSEQRIAQLREKYKQAQSQLEFAGDGAFDLLKQGRYADFFVKASGDAFTSAPSFVMAMVPVVGPPMSGVATAKSKYDEIKEQYGDVMTADGAINATITGGLDALGAKFTSGIGKVAYELATNIGTIATKRTIGAVLKSIGFKMVGSTSQESLEEGLVQFAENIVDKATINPNINLSDGVLESAAAGGILGPIPIALGGGVKLARFRGDQAAYKRQLILNAIDVMTKSHQAFYDPKDVSTDTVNETVDAYLSDLAQSIVSRSKGKYDEKTVLQSPEYLAIANNREQIVKSISQAVGLAETFSQLSEAEQAFSSYLDTIESQGTKVRTDEDIQNALTNFYQANPDAAKEESRLLMVGRAFASQKQEQDATQKVENLQPQGGELQPVGTEEGQQVQGTGQEAQPGTDAGDLAAVGGMQAGQVTTQPPVEGVEQPTVTQPTEGAAQPEPTVVAPPAPVITPIEPAAPIAAPAEPAAAPTAPEPTGVTPTPAWTTPSIAINKTTVYSGSPLSNGLFVKRKTSKDIKKGETFYVITPDQLNENKGAFDLSRDVETAQAALDALEENITNAFDIEGDVTGRITVDMIDRIIPGEVKMFRKFDNKTKKYREYWRITEKGKIILKKPGATPTAPTAAPEPTGVTPEPTPTAPTATQPEPVGATPTAPTAAPTAAGVTPTEGPRRVTKIFSDETIESGNLKGKNRKVNQTSYIASVDGTDVVVTEYESSVDDKQAIIGGREMTVGEFRSEFPLVRDEIAGLNDGQVITVLKVNRTKSGSSVGSTVEVLPFEALTIQRFKDLMKIQYDQYKRRYGKNKSYFDQTIGNYWQRAMDLVENGTIKISLQGNKLQYEIPSDITGELRDKAEALLRLTISNTDINPMNFAIEQDDGEYNAALSDLGAEAQPTAAPTATLVEPQRPKSPYGITGKRKETIQSPADRRKKIAIYDSAQTTADELLNEFEKQGERRWIDEKEFRRIHERVLTVSRILSRFGIKIYFTAKMEKSSSVIKGAYFNEKLGGGKQYIVISAKDATVSTVVHEAFHAIIRNGKLSSTQVVKDLYNPIMNILKNNPDTVETYNKIQDWLRGAKYERGEVPEEFLAQLSGYISDGIGKHPFDKSAIAKLERVINNVLEKLLGKDVLVVRFTNNADVIDFFNTLADGLTAGDTAQVERALELYESGRVTNPRKTIYFKGTEIPNGRKFVENVLNALERIESESAKYPQGGVINELTIIDGIQRIINSTLKLIPGLEKTSVTINTGKDARNLIVEMSDKNTIQGKKIGATAKKIQDAIADIVLAINDYLASRGNDPQLEEYKLDPIDGQDTVQSDINAEMMPEEVRNPDKTQFNKQQEMVKSIQEAISNLDRERQKIAFAIRNKAKFISEKTKANTVSSSMRVAGISPVVSELLTGITSDVVGNPRISIGARTARIKKNIGTGESGTLSSFLSFSDMYDLIPQLADYTVKHDAAVGNGQATIDLDARTISVGDMNTEQDFFIALMNEVRYAAQDFELFEAGVTPEGSLDAQEMFAAMRTQINMHVKQLQDKLDRDKKAGMNEQFIADSQAILDEAKAQATQINSIGDRTTYFNYVRSTTPSISSDALAKMDPSDRTNILADQMDFDGTTEELLFEVADTEQFASQDSMVKSRKIFDQTKFISVANAMQRLATMNPDYLRPVLNAVRDMRRRTRNGELQPSDVAKAWMMSVASQQAGPIDAATANKHLASKGINVVLDESVFAEAYSKKDRKTNETVIKQGGIRPEAMAAMMLSSSMGRKFLSDLNKGKVDIGFIDKFTDAISVYGMQSEKRKNIVGDTKKKGIYQIQEVTKNLNEIGKKGPGANEEFYNELMTLGMIGTGKAGFMGQFLGISNRGVIDSRQLDFWIQNGGDGKKKISQKASEELIARIGMVAKRLGHTEEDAYIAHHLIWDKVGGIEVVHQSMYELMMDYNLQDEQNMMFEMAENSVPDTLSSSIKSNPNFRPAVRLIDTYLNDDTQMTPYSTDHELARALIMQFGFSPYEARQLIEHRAGRRYRAAHPMTVDADASYEAMIHYFKQASVWSKEGREKWKQFAYSLDLWVGNYLTGVRTLMNQLTKQAGAGTTPSELNAYAALQNMRGKSAFRIMNYRDKFIGDPESVSSKRDSFIGRLSSALGKGATEMFNKFMIAQHQEERYDRLINKQLKKITEIMRVMSEKDMEVQEKQDLINTLNAVINEVTNSGYNLTSIDNQIKSLENAVEKINKKNDSARKVLNEQIKFLQDLRTRKESAIEFREKTFGEMTPEQLAKAKEFYAEFKKDYIDEFVNVLLDANIITPQRAKHLLDGTIGDDVATFTNHVPGSPGYTSVGWQFYVPLLIEESAYADEYGEFQSPMDGAPNGKSFSTIANPGIQRLRGAVAFGEQDIQNILHVVFDKLTKATVLAEQNMARQTMADMLQQYPSQTLYVDSKGNEHPRYQIIGSRARPVVNEFGEVVGVDDYTPEVVKKQSIQFIDKDGKMKYMFFANANDPVLLGARAKPSEFSAMGKGIIKGLNILNNVFRPLITQFSPTFIIQNPFRDVQEALISIDTEGKQIRPTSRKLKRSLLKNYFKAIAFFAGNTWLAKAMGVDNKTSKSAWRRQMYDMWMEVQQEGGRMSWAMLGTNPTESMESLQKSMLDAELAATANPSNEQVQSWMQGVQSDIAAKQAEIDAIIAASTTTTTTAATTGTTTALSAEDKAKVAKLTAQKKALELKLKAIEKTVNAAGQVVYRVKNPKFLIKDAFLQLSKLSDFTENLSRLAAHTTVREAGGSPREGAMVARNITINFEKRGLADALRAGNAGWLFLNVGIQGARRFGKLLANPEGRKAMLTLIILSAANRALFHTFTDDEEEEYNKKKYIYSDYIGRNKTLVHNPFNPNAPIMIPKAYGLSRLAYTLGEGMVDMAYELKSPGDIAIDATMDILTAVDPIGGGSSAPVNYLPVAALSPLFQVAFNQDYMGNEIMRSYGFSSSMMPDYQKKYKTTEEWAVKFAEVMYNIPIGPDVSPITIEFLAKEYGGLGPARFLQNINDMAKLAEENGEQLGIDKALLSTIKPLYREDISEKAAYDMYILLDVVRQSGARSAITGIPEGKKKFMKDALDHVRQKELMKPQQIVQMKKALRARYPNEEKFIDGL
jgi:hypothetical protein